MKHISVEGLNKSCSSLVMGSVMLSPDNMDYVGELLDTYIKIGGNTVDTAFIYGGGKCEQAFGMWMKERDNREDIVIISKGAHHDQNGSRVNPQAIENDLLTSLERLQVDYVDIYMLHRDDPNVPVSTIIDSLNEHVQAGRVRALGVSNWTTERIDEANEYAAKHQLSGFVCNSPNFSLAKPNEPMWKDCISADDAYVSWHESRNMPLFSWSSQAGGFFSGRFSPHNRENKDMVRVYYSDANWERYRRAEQLAKERNVEPIQIALAYVLNHSFPIGAIIGPRSVQEIESCLEASEITLSAAERKWLNLEE